MSRKQFSGLCVGGPYDGQMMVHWSKSKELYRPMVDGSTMNITSAQVEAISIGEYRLNDFGQWHWWETDAGKAYNVLFGGDR